MSEKRHVDMLLVASGDEKKLFENIAKRFEYSFECLENLDQVLESDADPSLMVVSEFNDNKDITVDELVQATRQQFPDAWLILSVKKELSKERFAFLAKLGAKIILLKTELKSSKLAFAINQTLKAPYAPIKTVDLVPDVEIPFTVYHLMPYRRKFLSLIRPGTKLSAEKFEKLTANPELYVPRDEMDKYKKFIEQTSDKSAKGLAKRCRANFKSLQNEFTNLVFELTDESNKVTFGEGQALLGRCKKLCDDLLVNLAEFPKAWEIINSSSVGEFGSVERAPAVAAYCGMFSLLFDLEGISEAMLMALLIDVGVLSLDDRIAEKLKNKEVLTAEDWEQMRLVPKRSLDRTLARKMAVPDKQRAVLLGVYEQADGKGYPNGIDANKLLVDSQMIRFSKEFDARTLLRMGQLKVSPRDAVHSIINDVEMQKVFTVGFLETLKKKIPDSFFD